MPVGSSVLLVVKFIALTLVGIRLSWLLVEDEILAPVRNKCIVAAQRKGWARWAMFFQCPFCIGFWSQVLLVAAVCWKVSLPLPVLWPFAINIVAAPVHHWIDRFTRD